MMPGFFRDMPKRKEWNKVAKWKIEVAVLFPFRHNVVYSSVYEGRLIGAYLKVRLKALQKDWDTAGEEYGIGWRISK